MTRRRKCFVGVACVLLLHLLVVALNIAIVEIAQLMNVVTSISRASATRPFPVSFAETLPEGGLRHAGMFPDDSNGTLSFIGIQAHHLALGMGGFGDIPAACKMAVKAATILSLGRTVADICKIDNPASTGVWDRCVFQPEAWARMKGFAMFLYNGGQSAGNNVARIFTRSHMQRYLETQVWTQPRFLGAPVKHTPIGVPWVNVTTGSFDDLWEVAAAAHRVHFFVDGELALTTDTLLAFYLRGHELVHSASTQRATSRPAIEVHSSSVGPAGAGAAAVADIGGAGVAADGRADL